MTTLREFSAAGPCLTYKYGEVVGETPKFWVYRARSNGYGEEVGTRRVKKSSVHTEPCLSCTDHPETHYPYGYMD